MSHDETRFKFFLFHAGVRLEVYKNIPHGKMLQYLHNIADNQTINNQAIKKQTADKKLQVKQRKIKLQMIN